jgi:hypothetical protein
MITFPETLDALERISENMRSVSEVETAIGDTVDNLNEYITLLEFSHEKDFKDPQEALDYIDHVLIPQLRTIIAALQAGHEEPSKRLRLASEQTNRLVMSLRMVVDGDVGGILP